MANLHKIRQRIIDRNYYLASHAEGEMLNDGLDRKDIENAILKGWIEKKMTRDVRGTRYRIEGPAMDGRPGNGRKANSCIVPISRRYKSCNHHCICFIGELMLCEFCGGETKKKV
jgi:hypothetical protein